MKFFSAIAIIIALVVGAALGYVFGTNQAQTQTTPQAAENTPAIPQTKIVVLGEQNESGQLGYATITEENGQVRVTINTVGGPEDVNQPAHIHTGSCPTPGGIVHPLTDVVNGSSETTIGTTMEQLDSRIPLAINVHESQAQINNYVSCGNLPD